MNGHREELLCLTGRQVEGQLGSADHRRLVELLQSDTELVELYTDYICLHGQLIWDAGRIDGQPTGRMHQFVENPENTVSRGRPVRRRLLVAAASLLGLLGGAFVFQTITAPSEDLIVQSEDRSEGPVERQESTIDSVQDLYTEDVTEEPLSPLPLHHLKVSPESVVNSDPATGDSDSNSGRFSEGVSDAVVVAEVDRLIEQGWKEHKIQPTKVAADAEWLRRIYLTLTGRIPTLTETQQFLADRSPRKRIALSQSLVDAPERAEYMATMWTNLLIGRTERRRVNREKLFEFLADDFRSNTPWIDTIESLITASGRNDENGATNFLLAHLNDQATPATAVTARLFLGEQISCVQCHDHPFTKDIRQEDYWALNAFFKDTVRVIVQDVSPETSSGTRSRYITCRLEDRPTVERITHFETRSGQMRAVLPKYDDYTVPEASMENRRARLASLLADDSDRKIARAMVNRMWAHFFGYGFTNPVDDMGPHAMVSHPEVLELLSEAFVQTDYDLRRLLTWIVSTQAWQLSSTSENSLDTPEHGEQPLFSRIYARRMAPEQVYESIRVAIRSASGQPLEQDPQTQDHRRSWVQQFARAYETDENDESLNFEGTITQALVMMNGSEVDEAIHLATGAIVDGLSTRSTENETLERVALAALTREPTDEERRAFRAHYRQLSRSLPGRQALPQAIEDMMWAYLNSSEFVLVH